MAFATEQELVDCAIRHFPVREWLQVPDDARVFQRTEVQGLFGIPDLLVAARPDAEIGDGVSIASIAFEMKLSDWRRGLAQAFRYRSFAKSTFLVIDDSRSRQAVANLERFQRANVGLIGLNTDGIFQVYVWPEQEEPFSRDLCHALITIVGVANLSPWRRTCQRPDRNEQKTKRKRRHCPGWSWFFIRLKNTRRK
jgi:hypothetical protein